MITNVYQSGSQFNPAGAYNPVTPSQVSYTIAWQGQLTGSSPAGSSYQTSITNHIFTADAPCQVVAVTERHSVLGSTAGMLVHAVGSTPLGSSANVLASTISHFSAVDVYQQGTLFNSTVLTVLAVGDGLGWRWSIPGALPPVGGVTVTLEYI
jgi:hypothetical protein